MASKRTQRWMRVWMLLMGVLFVARCVEQARPYVTQIVQPMRPAVRQETAAQPRDGRHLRIASWNLEWLDEPAQGVKHRSLADLARLATYAQRLDPDVVAVQEVASGEALSRVFDPQVYAFHLTSSHLRQRVGFVVRRTLTFAAEPDVNELSEGHLRPGADIRVQTESGSLRLLSVHLKASCTAGALDVADRDCRKLAEQVPVLERWIDDRARAGEAFAVLGDFNRAFDDVDPLWAEIDDGEPSSLSIVRADLGQRSLCQSQRHARPFIDHLWFGGPAARWVMAGTFRELRYESEDKARHHKLSDHCPIVVGLELPRRRAP